MPSSEPRTPGGPIAAERGALLGLASDLAREAGNLAHAGQAEMLGGVHAKSTPTDLVTQLDLAAERLIVDRLQRARPGDGVLGEEGSEIPSQTGYTWLLDPIDGTTNFVYGLAAWCTSVAVQYEGETIAGAVYVPSSDELFAAAAGRGATLNDRRIVCSVRDELSLALIATGFGYRAEVRIEQARRITAMIGAVRDVRRLGSAAVDLCHVAVGRVDAYFEEHLNAWDIAAGELIAREAGAISSNFSGDPPNPRELVVATPEIHRPLLDLLRHSVNTTTLR